MYKVFVLFFAFFITVSAFAESITPLNHFFAWRAYKGFQNGQTVCYMAATPRSGKREGRYLMISRRPGAKKYNEIIVFQGAKYHQNSKPVMKVDSKKDVPLVFSGDKAWVKLLADEKKLISEMKEGNEVRVNGKSARGTRLTDTYSLKGFTKALAVITKECP